MPEYHIGVVKFYNPIRECGYVIARNTEFQVKGVDLAQFIPTSGSVICFTEPAPHLIHHLSKVTIPWNDVFSNYGGQDFTITYTDNRNVDHSIDLLEPCIKAASDHDVSRFISRLNFSLQNNLIVLSDRLSNILIQSIKDQSIYGKRIPDDCKEDLNGIIEHIGISRIQAFLSSYKVPSSWDESPEVLSNVFNKLSRNEYLSLFGNTPVSNKSFNDAFIGEITNKINADDFRPLFDHRNNKNISLFQWVINEQKDEVISSLFKKFNDNDDFFSCCAPFYAGFKSGLKGDFLQQLCKKERSLKILRRKVEPTDISLIDVLSADEYYKDHPELHLENDFEDVCNFICKKYGYTELRDIQKSAIRKILQEEGQNYLTIVPTGGGKSTIFQGPILYKAIKALNDNKCVKLSIVVTPLQALMEDQVENLKSILDSSEKGLVAGINANTSSKDRKYIIKRIREHKLALLYIAPERLMDSWFFIKVIQRAANEQGLDSIIFDEAHCITAWGMDFRSDYILALRKCLTLQKAHKNITIQMYTATLPYQSKEELKAEVYFGPNDINILPRPDAYEEDYKESLCPIQGHIELKVQKLDDSKDEAFTRKIDATVKSLNDEAINNMLNGLSRMIVFTRTRDEAEQACDMLKEKLPEFKDRIEYFHARITRKKKENIIKDYKDGKTLIICATKAFGLGMDIPNIHYLYHLTPPTFIEDYLQEVGRAGRDKKVYEEVFENGERIQATCFYTASDLEGKIDRVGCLSPNDITTSFNLILSYVKDFENTKGSYVVPVDLMSRRINTPEDASVKHNKTDEEEVFQQCIGWLSKKCDKDEKTRGLNRIEVSFRCPDSYDLGFDSDAKGVNESSQLGRLIAHIKNYKADRLSRNSERVIINTNEVISYESLGINSPEELECLIEDGINLGVFNNDYSYIKVSVKKKSFVRDFLEKKVGLEALEIITNLLQDRSSNADEFNFEKVLSQEYGECNSKILEVVKSQWNFFMDLNILYEPSFIKEKVEILVRTIGESQSESVSWKTLSECLGANDSPNQVKLFLIAAYKLGYTTKSETSRDFIEIKVINSNPISDTDENDVLAMKEIVQFYNNKQMRAGAMCGLIEDYKSSKETKETIQAYSACPDAKLAELKVFENREDRLAAKESLEHSISIELNEEQRRIYDLDSNININVRAGAGSGKTRLLIYRALKLILVDGNRESDILILAYNNAVRDEIEKRVSDYSHKIGFTIHNAQIYTFHAFAAHCCPELNDRESRVDYDEWEDTLLNDIIKNPDKYSGKYRHILIDEFQDVTTTRLEIISRLITLNTTDYQHAKAFVIGDMFQSIYGYQKKIDYKKNSDRDEIKPIESIEPIEYYKRLSEKFPDSGFEKEYTLTNNYRSTQAIINTAESWFTNLPHKLKSMIDDSSYSGIVAPYSERDWQTDFPEIWKKFKKNDKNLSLGILFRNNSDVQAAYKWLKDQSYLKDVDIRIQGSDVFFNTTREFFFFKKGINDIEEADKAEATKEGIDRIYKDMHNSKVYDKEILDVAKSLAEHILEKGNISYAQLCIEFDKLASRLKNGLKEYLNRKAEDMRVSITVSTIHKIKGLEFDSVIIPASNCPIGFGNDDLSDDEKNMEERRLMYVAFSRAKSGLYYYEGEREKCIRKNSPFEGVNGLCYAEDGQSKVDCGFLVKSSSFCENSYIRENVKIDDPITLCKNKYGDWVIYHRKEEEQQEHEIGKLSRTNKFLNKLIDHAGVRIPGLFVKSVNIIKEEDEKYHDWEKSQNAKDQGYVYYIDYYGCINI